MLTVKKYFSIYRKIYSYKEKISNIRKHYCLTYSKTPA